MTNNAVEKKKKKNIWNASGRRQHSFITQQGNWENPILGQCFLFTALPKLNHLPSRPFFTLAYLNWGSFICFIRIPPFRYMILSIWCCINQSSSNLTNPHFLYPKPYAGAILSFHFTEGKSSFIQTFLHPCISKQGQFDLFHMYFSLLGIWFSLCYCTS